MKVTPVSNPNAVQNIGSDWDSNAATAKARALAAFKNPQATPAPVVQEQLPVPNANAVAPEDLSAIRPASQVNQINAETLSPGEGSDINANASTEVTSTPEEIRKQASQDPESQRRFEQLARQEKAFRAKVQQAQTKLNQRDSELRTREEALKQRETVPQQTLDMSKYVSLDDIKNDAATILDAAGVDWNQLTQDVVNRGQTDPRVLRMLQQQANEIKSLKGEIENSKTNQTQAQKDAYQSAVKQIRADATKLVSNDPEFEITKFHGQNGINEVVKLIEKVYAKDGVVLDVEEAAKLVEEDYAMEAERLSKLGKVQKRQGSTTVASQKPTEVKTQTNPQQQTRTLTNAVSTQRPLTARERAVAAFERKTQG